MSFYSDASLVMIPSGYKTSKVYSAVPTDGAGDLSFSRSNDTATRVNSAGLIEKVRTNLALQSQTFDNAAWGIVGGSSVTANTTTAPDGTLTADTLTVATNNFSGLAQTFTTSTNAWTISLFVKKGTKDFLYIFDPTTTGRAHFNLTTGAVATTLNVTASMTAVGNGWFRCSVTRSITGTAGHYFQFGLSDTDNTILPTSAGTAFIWGAQAEVSDFGATSYIATTTAAVSVGPVANVPRLDYLNSSCPRLILEGQRTNLALFSEQLNNAAWLTGGVTITANQTTSPDGYVNADKVQSNTTAIPHYFGPALMSFVAGTTYTASVFVKRDTGRYFQLLYGSGAFTINDYANFDLQNGVVTFEGSGADATITDYSNGWYRCSITSTCSANFSDSAYSAIITTANAARVETHSTALSYWAYGYQLEAGAYATSYIPTLGAAVTRGADACSKTGISSLIGQTEGTLFVDINYNGNKDVAGSVPIRIYTGTNEAYIFITNANALQCELYDITQQCIITGSIGAVGRKKIAFAYKQNDFVVYMNGVQIGTDTSGTVGAMANLEVGRYASGTNYITLNGMNQSLLFKTRLTNAQLAELTTL